MPVTGVPASARTSVNRFHHATNVSDAFTRADSSTSIGTADTGQSWTNSTGTWGIKTNQAYLATAAVSGANLATITGGSADGFIQFTIDGTPADNMGGAFRAVDVSNHWRVARAASFGTWNIYKRVSGTDTLVANTGNTATAAGTIVRVEFVGSTIWTFFNGTFVKAVSDSAMSSNTGVGLFGGASMGTNPRWDDFTAGG